MITKLIAERIHEEWQDSELALPQWLADIADDDLYYVVALVITCANCFALGMCIGLAL